MSGIEKVVGMIVGGVVILLIAGYVFVNLWPAVGDVTANVSAMTGTDTGTSIFQALWPVVILIVAIVIVVSLIFWAVKQLRD